MSEYLVGKPLFNEIEWFDIQKRRKESLRQEVMDLDGDRLLNTATSDFCEYLLEKYKIDVPMIHEDGIRVDDREVQIDVTKRRDYDSFPRDRSRPVVVTGTGVDVIIPYEGDAEMFNVQPKTHSSMPPLGQVLGRNLILSFQDTQIDEERLKTSMARTIGSIKKYLENLRICADALFDELQRLASDLVNHRREKLLSDRRLVAALGYPLVERADSQRTYTLPAVRRRINPRPPTASIAPYKPEHALNTDDYEHILSVISNMAQVMEKSPSAFKSMHEETLRFHFLVQLNGHYEGDATGETFNYGGKTDIFVRAGGRCIFIAECKYWGGPKKLLETIDQILGYATWRDTKLAIILFNRNKNLSKVLAAIPSTVAGHSSFKRRVKRIAETEFRYVICHRDDPNREMILTIQVFDVPL